MVAHSFVIDMADDPEEKIADRRAEAYKKDRRLDEAESSENPDRVGRFNRRADRRREGYVRANYDESVTEGETERKDGPQ